MGVVVVERVELVKAHRKGKGGKGREEVGEEGNCQPGLKLFSIRANNCSSLEHVLERIQLRTSQLIMNNGPKLP